MGDSYRCAAETVSRPDAFSASDGKPNFASKAYQPPSRVVFFESALVSEGS